MIRICVATDFSRYPGGRYYLDGKYSGERFRDELIEPALKDNEKVEIFLDGTIGYGSCFLEEVFGGLVRKGFSKESLLEKLVLITKRERLIIEIQQYIENAEA